MALHITDFTYRLFTYKLMTLLIRVNKKLTSWIGGKEGKLCLLMGKVVISIDVVSCVFKAVPIEGKACYTIFTVHCQCSQPTNSYRK